MNKIMITGAAGFFGKYICKELNKQYKVIAVDYFEFEKYYYSEFIKVTENNKLSNIIKKVQPDIVIHGAFVNRKPEKWSDSDYLSSLLTTDYSVMDECEKLNIPIIVIGSSAVYGNGDKNKKILESDLLLPVSLYGIAKLNQENIARYFNRTKTLQYAILRFFNLIGPGQSLGMLFPDWVKKVFDLKNKGGKKFEVRTLNTWRDFVDVRDASKAIRLLLENYKSGFCFNVSQGEAISLKEIAEELKKISLVNFSISEQQNELKSSNPLIQKGSSEFINEKLNWNPSYNWKQSLKDTWDEYVLKQQGKF